MLLMKTRIESLLTQLTLEEKAALCSGQNNWSSQPIERLNIPSIYMTDGPHGLRREADDGFGNSLPATCFPTAACLASSWNTDLLTRVGEAIGKECQTQGVQILLGPGANIKRSPLNGRNFEYFSEDPIVSGEMAAALISGIQSQGVGTSLKHYVANNQEFERMSINAQVDERALREIYLAGFEIAVKKAQPYTLMCAYNKINGVFGSENTYLLHDILKKEWQYKGIVMSDWDAVHDRVAGIKAGLHLEMPGNEGVNDRKIIEAVRNGNLDESRLDEVLTEWLNIILTLQDAKQENATFNTKEHHQLAQEAASEGIVLLKNEANLLPLDTQKTASIAVIGQFSQQPRFQGSGSSRVIPTDVDNLFDSLSAQLPNGNLTYAAGYDKAHKVDDQLISEAVKTAQNSELAIICVGLPESFETEGIDRKHIKLPESHRTLVEQILKVQPNTIVILTNGSPVEMPWLNEASTVVEGWLFGQGGGAAMANILTGKINPSGKLTETFPIRLEDSPSFLHFPGTAKEVKYSEGIFVGYRYFEKKKIKPLFPFGHGLSYTTFEYSNLMVSNSKIADNGLLIVQFSITNTGKTTGKESAQLYIQDVESSIIRPEKELKHFAKIALAPNETKEIKFELNRRDFAFYDPISKSWKVEKGNFNLLIGASSTDIRLQKTIHIHTVHNQLPPLDQYSTIKEFLAHPVGQPLVQPIYEDLLAFATRSVPDDQPEKQQEIKQFFVYIFNDMPFYKIEAVSNGRISEAQLQEILAQL